MVNPMECWEGEWIEIIIDCAEQMGVPCEGGIYIPPEEGECCSICLITGDINGDGTFDVLDVILLMNIILTLENDYTICQEDASDMNSDGVIDILDVILLVNIILGP